MSTVIASDSPRRLPLARAGHRPSQYTRHARNPESNVQIGGDATVFAPALRLTVRP